MPSLDKIYVCLTLLFHLGNTSTSLGNPKGILSQFQRNEAELQNAITDAALHNSFWPPPSKHVMNDQLSAYYQTCNCKTILVSSLGEGQHVQHTSMGVYKYYQSYNGHPAYHSSNGNRLYFLTGSGWLIGPSLGNPSGFVHNGNQYQCPYLIPQGWMYVNSGYWYIDETLVVRCIQ